jgi:hypothetical protein
MKVRMKVGVSGTRNGEDWPGPGGELEVDDEEGAQLCASGLAEPVVEKKTETATAPKAEQRAKKTT